MDEQLNAIENQVPRRDFESPPLHLWHPELSGDIPIVITADGSWYHDGGKIERDSIVRLFTSILRREEDGEYYLVTPGEKWRIEVEAYPLIVVDVDRVRVAGTVILRATLNNGKQIDISAEHPLSLDSSRGDIAVLALDHGLAALFSRAAWYRLVEMASTAGGKLFVASGDYRFSLGKT